MLCAEAGGVASSVPGVGQGGVCQPLDGGGGGRKGSLTCPCPPHSEGSSCSSNTGLGSCIPMVQGASPGVPFTPTLPQDMLPGAAMCPMWHSACPTHPHTVPQIYSWMQGCTYPAPMARQHRLPGEGKEKKRNADSSDPSQSVLVPHSSAPSPVALDFLERSLSAPLI